MDLGQVVTQTMTDQKILGALLSTVAIILIGFYFRKKEIFSAEAGRWLAQVVLRVSLPALAFGSFMMDMDPNMLRTGANVLLWGIILYILMILVTPLIYRRYAADVLELSPAPSALRPLTHHPHQTYRSFPHRKDPS